MGIGALGPSLDPHCIRRHANRCLGALHSQQTPSAGKPVNNLDVYPLQLPNMPSPQQAIVSQHPDEALQSRVPAAPKLCKLKLTLHPKAVSVAGTEEWRQCTRSRTARIGGGDGPSGKWRRERHAPGRGLTGRFPAPPQPKERQTSLTQYHLNVGTNGEGIQRR